MNEGIAVKANALEILDKQLTAKAKKNQFGIVAVGSGTDAYMHQEETIKMTEGILKLLLKHQFPVFISTKCTLIKRDIQLLQQINKKAILPDDLNGKLAAAVILSVSVSTLNNKISDMLEPGAASPAQRLELVTQLKQEGLLVGVNAIPLLPFISDTEEEIENIILAAKKSGADYILTGGLTLFGKEPADSKTLFYKFLERYDPSILPAYQQLYGSNFYTPFSYQRIVKDRAERLCRKHHISNCILQ